VADVPPSDLRIGDSERENALTALAEHMSAGRLDIDEYGDRTAKVAAAKTRGELLALFTDLPAPHPVFGQQGQPARTAQGTPSAGTGLPQAMPEQNVPVPASSMPLAQRIVAGAVPLAGIIAVLLFFTFGHAWQFFLIPAGVAILSGVFFGDEWKHNQRMVREKQRQERRQMRRRYRGY
jgi:Domain of unknown function (DUF1707)